MPRPPNYQKAIPSKIELLRLIGSHPRGIGKREIKNTLKIDAGRWNKLELQLNKLIEEGAITLVSGKIYHKSDLIPRVTVIEVSSIEQNEDILAKPVNWQLDIEPPRIYLKSSKRFKSSPGTGDRFLARLLRLDDGTYNADIIRPLKNRSKTIVGIFSGGNCIQSTSRGKNKYYIVDPKDSLNAELGELVVAKLLPTRKHEVPKAKVLELLGRVNKIHTFSQIAIHLHDIPHDFSKEVLEQTAACQFSTFQDRADLRSLPLVTIDGESARDFDDAIFAEPWKEKQNGWHIIIAIADVAWYVRPETPLDLEARKRGNSVYFPDKVVPMLPDSLSNGWCSLKPKEDRACLAVHIWIDDKGNIICHKLERAVMNSHARLTYTQVQQAHDGFPDSVTANLIESVINPIFNAYHCLALARNRRQPLEIKTPDTEIILDDHGNTIKLFERPNLASHDLIEEFMITANVVAAKTLENHKLPFLYRVHNKPPEDKLHNFREYIHSLELHLPKGQVVKPSHFNDLIKNASELKISAAMGNAVLRTQSKALYSIENSSHYGLALNSYCHFTSPIRRYADLIIHRALISVLNLGDGGSQTDHGELHQIANYLLMTEQRASQAERDTLDRFTAEFFVKKIGQEVTGIVSGITKFGIFVTINGFASEGLIPIRSITMDYFHFNEKKRFLRGRKTGYVLSIGDEVKVLIEDAHPISGSITLTLCGLTKQN